MCSCSDSALENEPEISFVDEEGNNAETYGQYGVYDSTTTEWDIIGVRITRYPWDVRDDIKFVVRGRLS